MAEEEKVTEMKEEKRQLTLRNSDLEGLINSRGLVNLRRSRDLPIVFSFRLDDLLGKLQPTIKAYSEQKQKLIDKYGDRDNEGKLVEQELGMFLFTINAQEFQREYTELLNQETTFDCEKLQISVNDIPVKIPIICPYCKRELKESSGVISTDDIGALRSIINFKEK